MTAAIPADGRRPCVHAEAVDAQGNVDVADADVTVTFDTVLRNLIAQSKWRRYLNADELGTGSFNAQVWDRMRTAQW
ncbi:hypothetical protein FDN01_03305 [Acinetobacter baumannii]|nr:hypothetical protein FDN01_03305 [Acinetobacter baumannii]